MAVLALYGRYSLALGYTTLCTARHRLEAAGLLGCLADQLAKWNGPGVVPGRLCTAHRN